jgi:uncharacterized protein YyaL (SSP411 family)
MSQPSRPANRLVHETSPYLRQHAHNPVDWFPWGDEALRQAREHDRPIFLSIGYSACHWCHVMEHESFEDEEIGRLLNESFVSIKVDREERPDLDQIYMGAVQALNQGRGGWPMSVFLTPALRPFHADTYIPPVDRYGKRGLKGLLKLIAEWWRTRRAEIDRAADGVTQHLQVMKIVPPSEGELSADLITTAVGALAQNYDARHGGFGSEPKFPHPVDVRLLLRAWKRNGDAHALEMARHTLDSMARGGIYDHLGGGFARYSTDARWLVPHFEKMLYDNALLVPCYLEALQVTGDEPFRVVVTETLAFIEREMTSPEGPFHSTLDADSEGVEGKFYVWTYEDVLSALGPQDGALFATVYGVEPAGNWRDPHGHAPPRANVLHRARSWEEHARHLNLPLADLHARMDACRRKLFAVRSKRVRPGLDDKALTAWNALMIGAFAQAAQVLDQPHYAGVAARAADFVLSHMRADSRLLRTWSHGSAAKLNAYHEDYAYLIDALVTLYEATFEGRWLSDALDVAEVMVEQFWDEAAGGFWFTGRDHEELIARQKDFYDNATPSGNAVAATGLLRLAALTGRTDLRERAERVLRLGQGLMTHLPQATGQLLIALDFWRGPVREVALVGDLTDAETRRVLQAVRATYEPNRVVAFRQAGAAEEAVADVPLLAGKTGLGGVTLYLCENFACQAPAVGAGAALAALGK